ncbi:MAG: phenylalanine--tRNA ligase subunit beta [Dissulfurispiraceae bacterium]|jgi:phenylalanyl-tRNA synthetase beta chain|nr:phenylalanine--tRNA ligase subunit beta [Dissulfurispiraceae bacterium]
MKVSYNWLKEIAALDAPVAEAAHRLTMAGLEVEAIEPAGDDYVLEVNVTPNRPDCLSVIGIARELSALYKTSINIPPHDVLAHTGELGFNVDILDYDLCNRYAGRIVRNVKISESPDWMKQRLEKCGIRPINNVVDITNYVLLEFGHPLHAFDLDKVKGNRIRIATAGQISEGKGAKITTLDGVERIVPADTLLILDSEAPIAVAGIMGGQGSEVDENTRDLFIESAYFDPSSVRKSSKILGLKTEASYRFERGSDIKALKKALDRAAYLLKDLAAGELYGKIDMYPKKYIPVSIDVRYEKVNRVLGLALGKEQMLECIEGLGIETEVFEEFFRAAIPSFRKDIKRDYDVIEEIARMYGYDNIPAVLPIAAVGIEAASKVSNTGMRLSEEIKQALLKSGCTEAVNLSFMSESDLDLLGISVDDERRRVVKLRNPLRSEEACMRTMILPSLLRNLAHNLAHSNRDVRLFELSKIFLSRGVGSLPEEKHTVCSIYYKEKAKALYPETANDFFVVKGIAEAILADIGLGSYSFIRSSEQFLHPGQSADIYSGDRKIGFLGAINPIVFEKLDIKASRPSLIVQEFFIDSISSLMFIEPKYSQLPKFPAIDRDVALILDASFAASELNSMISSFGSGLVEGASIFDVYQGSNIPEGKKSIAFSIKYRASDRTLTEEEIELLHNRMVAFLSEKTGGQVRR